MTPKVLEPALEVEWGDGWQEIAKPVEFAQWYSGVEWHRASADTLRTGMSGVGHMQQRVQQLTVLLGQAEQALASTQRLREQEARERSTKVEQEEYQDETLRELQEQQEAQLAALEQDRQKLMDQLNDLQSALEAAVSEKERAIEDQQESLEEQHKMRSIMASLRTELIGMKQSFTKETEALKLQLKEAVAKSMELETEKGKWSETVQLLETQLAQQQAGCQASSVLLC